MTKRKKRENPTIQADLLKPLDIFSLGSEDDPCFGKLHDLNAMECRECGDSEFCAIVKSQNLHKIRLSQEAEQRFKDIEESDQDILNKKQEVRGVIKTYKDKGVKRIKTILKISREFNLPKDVVKQMYDEN